MTKQAQIVFSTDGKEFQTSVQQLLVNRQDFMGSDIAEIQVGNVIALRAVGTETTIDGIGQQFGIARLPLSVLSKLSVLADQFKTKIINISFKNGAAKIETASVKHPGIILGETSSAPISIPVNASALDALATSEVTPKADISDAGLKARLARAIEARDAVVQTAFNALKEFGVEEGEVQELVDKHIREFAEGVKKALGKRRGIHPV
jgi:hypothetical protein